MPQELQEQQTSNHETVDERLSEPRELLRGSLKDIASKVRTALDNAALGIPVFLIIPSSGQAILTFGTLLDPSDEDWSRATKIVCGIVSKVAGLDGLHSRELACASSSGPLSANDVSGRR
jgi:hypothetical protein